MTSPTPSHAAPDLPATSSAAGAGLGRIVGELLGVQADLTVVIAFLDAILAAEEISRPVDQHARIEGLRAQDGPHVGTQQVQIATAMGRVYASHDAPDVTAHRGDLGLLENDWEAIAVDPVWRELEAGRPLITILPAADAPATLAPARVLRDRCRRLRRAIGLFTIPKRIGAFLAEGFGVGAPLDFHERFAGELDDPADRALLLGRLAELSADRIGGLVDVSSGVIYRIGARRRRVRSYLLLVGAALLGLVATLILDRGDVIALPGFAAGDRDYGQGELVVGFLLTVLGVTAHVIMKAAEFSIAQRSRGAEGSAREVILDRLPLWIHVREYRFLVAVLTAMIAFGMLVVSGQLVPLTALFAGYTVDSVSDLVLQRFNGAVSSQSVAVERAIVRTIG